MAVGAGGEQLRGEANGHFVDRDVSATPRQV